MYESYFGLVRRPFAAVPTADRYFPGSSSEAARTSLTRCIDRAAGAGLLVGPSGTGKTILLNVLAQHFRPRMQAALLSGGHLASRRALLQAILFELGLPYRRVEEGDLRLSLIDYLTRGDKCPGGLLLLIDEAHALPLKLLEEVRMITNLARGGQPCVHLVLAGAPAIEERLASPKLESLNQRLAARCYLEPLAKAETRDYVRYQIAAAGGNVEQVFTPDALDAVYQATDGVPRVLNQVCDHALMLAYADDRRRLDAAAVERAWADLQQLPAPWVAKFTAPAEASAAQRDILEFGDLEEETSDEDQAFQSYDDATADVDEPATMPLTTVVAAVRETAHEEPPAEWETVSAASTFSGSFGEGVDAADARAEIAALDRQPVEDLDRSGLRISRGEPADRAAGDALHEELVVDLYAELDAQQVQRDGRPAMAAAWTHSAEPDWLAGLPRVKENTPEETLSLAEALLQREMAADERPQGTDHLATADSIAPAGGDAEPATSAEESESNVLAGDWHASEEGVTFDAAEEPSAGGLVPGIRERDEGAASDEPLESLPFLDGSDEVELVLPFDEAEAGMLLLPLVRERGQPAWPEPRPHDDGELAGETIPLSHSDGLHHADELSFGDDDRDLIVVEEHVTAAEVEPLTAPADESVAVVRPREFRQLFAKMRRG